MRLVFASNNAHKLAEVKQIMPANVEVLSLRDIGFVHDIEETGTTLEENSYIKASTVAAFINDKMSASLNDEMMIDGVFADDTGLEIDALGGAPGVYTARWYRLNDGMSAASPLNDEMSAALNDEMMIFAANRKKALRELEGKTDRGAQFRTVITLIKKNGEQIAVSGIVRGRMATEEYGQGGFGYDPIFIPEGYDKTFGELPAELKNHISHRARALAELVKLLNR